MSEIFTKKGELRKRAPKRYECKSCGHKTSSPKTVKLGGIGFYVCRMCGGSIKERDVYIEWEKRTTGQWNMENKILEYIKKNNEVSKSQLSKHFNDEDEIIFYKALGELVYWGKLKVAKNDEEIIYKIN